MEPHREQGITAQFARASIGGKRGVALAAAPLLIVSSVAFAHTGAAVRPAEPPLARSFVVASNFDAAFREVLDLSPTVRRQYEEIAEFADVRVYVRVAFVLPADRFAQTTFRRSVSGELEARIEIAAPRRVDQYAEQLGHEFEHVLEQIEGLDLERLARGRDDGVNRTVGGAYETERAIRAGRQAAHEVLKGDTIPSR